MTVFIKNFYSSTQQYEKLNEVAFDEGPIIRSRVVGINSSSIDTSLFDAFRQGVEITQEKHTLGCFKISAGTPGHIVQPVSFGVNNFDIISTGSFVEIEYFSPVSYLAAQEPGATYARAVTFPIITADSNQVENYVLNGIIEPLTIRPVISFFSIEWPYESHAFRGQLMGGNENKITFSSDRVLTVDYRPTRLAPLKILPSSSIDSRAYVNEELYLDAFESAKEGLSVSQQTVGYINSNFNSIDAFSDEVGGIGSYLKDLGITPATHGADMVLVFQSMTGSSENYVPPSKKSATAGFVYNTINGTDSIAFGDMTY